MSNIIIQRHAYSICYTYGFLPAFGTKCELRTQDGDTNCIRIAKPGHSTNILIKYNPDDLPKSD